MQAPTYNQSAAREAPECLSWGDTLSKIHSPTVGIVITHFNYSSCLKDALISVQQQTYKNLKCIVVDDNSDNFHCETAQNLIAELCDERFTFLKNETNLGQIPTFYRGMDSLDTEFVALLDPDDRYKPEFISVMLGLHQNSYVLCPIVSCDQDLIKHGDGVIVREYSKCKQASTNFSGLSEAELTTFRNFGFHKFAPPTEVGWFWGTTSSNLFRSSALKLFRPRRMLSYKRAADSYLAKGAHMLGGTLILRHSLIYRGLHPTNSWIPQGVFSPYQLESRSGTVQWGNQCFRDIVESFLSGEGTEQFSRSNIAAVINSHFKGHELALLQGQVSSVADFLGQ